MPNVFKIQSLMRWKNYDILASKTPFKETHFRFKDTNMVKVKEWKSICHANSDRYGVVKLVSDKKKFITKLLF